MKINVTLNVKSENELLSKDLDLYNSPDWTTKDEAQLLQHIYELLPLIRTTSSTLDVCIKVKGKNFIEINKLLNTRLTKRTVKKTKKLSGREIDVLRLIIMGFTNKEIAEKLFVSFETIRTHRKNIHRKTNTITTAALVNYYYQCMANVEI